MKLIMIIATGFYSGYLPKAPGTWGSAVGLAIYYLLHGFALPVYLLAVAIVIVVGIFAAGSAEKILDQKDPGPIVIDEIAGMLITLIAAPPYIWAWILGFFIFRFFDIIKPFPVRWIDQNINGGVGIMMDDVAAGIYSFLVLQTVVFFI